MMTLCYLTLDGLKSRRTISCEVGVRCQLMVATCRDGSTRVLITTDVWARGLDVQQVILL